MFLLIVVQMCGFSSFVTFYRKLHNTCLWFKPILALEYCNFMVHNCHCRVTFFWPSPRCMGPQTSEPGTMNLQRMGQKARLQCIDNGHHGVLQGPSFPERIGPRHDLRSFFWYLWYVGGGGISAPASSVSLYSLFIVVPFFLNGVPGVGACPISPSLQLLGMVVRTEKYGRVRHKALNTIMTAFPLGTSAFSVVLFCFSVFPALWNDMEYH